MDQKNIYRSSYCWRSDPSSEKEEEEEDKRDSKNVYHIIEYCTYLSWYYSNCISIPHKVNDEIFVQKNLYYRTISHKSFTS
ncbi:MAG: hypothetical protein ACI8RD_005649 [Bacillariaceae sp.]|jgi:hypothetical protein